MKSDTNDTMIITIQQLRWLLEGLKIEQKTAFKPQEYEYV